MKPNVYILNSQIPSFPSWYEKSLVSAGYKVARLASADEFKNKPELFDAELTIAEVGSIADADQAQAVFEWREEYFRRGFARLILIVSTKDLAVIRKIQRIGAGEIIQMPIPEKTLLFKISLQENILKPPAAAPLKKNIESEQKIDPVEERKKMVILRGPEFKTGEWRESGFTPQGKTRWRWVKSENSELKQLEFSAEFGAVSEDIDWELESSDKPEYDPFLKEWVTADANAKVERKAKTYHKEEAVAGEQSATKHTLEAETKNQITPIANNEEKKREEKQAEAVPEQDKISPESDFEARKPMKDNDLESSADKSRIQSKKAEITSKNEEKSKKHAVESNSLNNTESEESEFKENEIEKNPWRFKSSNRQNENKEKKKHESLDDTREIIPLSEDQDASSQRKNNNPKGFQKNEAATEEQKLAKDRENEEKIRKKSIPIEKSSNIAIEKKPALESDTKEYQEKEKAWNILEKKNADKKETILGDRGSTYKDELTDFINKLKSEDLIKLDKQKKKEKLSQNASDLQKSDIKRIEPKKSEKLSTKNEMEKGEFFSADSEDSAKKQKHKLDTYKGMQDKRSDLTEEKRKGYLLSFGKESEQKKIFDKEPDEEKIPIERKVSGDYLKTVEDLRIIDDKIEGEVFQKKIPSTYGRLNFIKTLKDLFDQDSSWERADSYRVYISAFHKYKGLSKIDDVLPIWVYLGEMPPEFLENEKSWKFYDRPPELYKNADQLPGAVREYLNKLASRQNWIQDILTNAKVQSDDMVKKSESQPEQLQFYFGQHQDSSHNQPFPENAEIKEKNMPPVLSNLAAKTINKKIWHQLWDKLKSFLGF